MEYIKLNIKIINQFLIYLYIKYKIKNKYMILIYIIKILYLI